MSSSSVVALVVFLSAPALAQAPYFSRRDLQQAVTEIDAVDLDGRRWNIEHLRGRVVLLEFWATWCAPCLDQIPLLQSLREEHAAKGFEVLGVSLNSSSRRDFVAWVNRQGLSWPQIHDGRAFNGLVARTFGVNALPASILLDGDGRIVAKNLRGESLRRVVEATLYRTSTSSLDAARMPMVKR